MKYLYKGLQLGGAAGEREGVNCAVLLGWHERVSCSWLHSLHRRTPLTHLSFRLQLTEVAGTGCIVRVMSDRRTV